MPGTFKDFPPPRRPSRWGVLGARTVIGGVVTAVTRGPGLVGAMVSVRDEHGLIHDFVTSEDGYERGDSVVVTLRKGSR